MDEFFVIYILLGAFSGFIAGLLGVGGGLIIVPVLVVMFQLQSMDSGHIMHMALATSLATIVITSIVAVIAHHKRSNLDWGIVSIMTPGLIIGALFGAWVADSLSSVFLQRIFGIFEIIIAIYMLLQTTKSTRPTRGAGKGELLSVATLIGYGGALLGIGGGTMTVPYLNWTGIEMKRAVAISSACGIPIALAGCLGYIAVGLDVSSLPASSAGYLYLPAFIGIIIGSILTAPLGASLVHSLPAVVLKRLFAVVLIVIGLGMTFIS